MIGIVIALIIVGFASMFAMVHSQSGTVRRIEETQLRQIGADTTAQKMIDQRIDNIITIHNATVEHYDSEIDKIIARMNEITADIQRLDTEMKYQQTRMNTVYPWFENSEYGTKANAGVKWAPEFPTQEEEHEISDN
jgi:hypothetical protein